MSREYIKKIMLVMWIYTVTIPFMMTLASNLTTIKSNEHAVTFMGAKNYKSGLNNRPNSRIVCPDDCVCFKKMNVLFTTARCNKFTDDTYFKVNIKHVSLEDGNNFTLGSQTFLKHGLENLKSINLTSNRVIKVHPDAFYGLEYLNSVKFDFNTRLDIHPDVFQNNPHLQFLEIKQFENFNYISNKTENYLFDAPILTHFIFFVPDYKYWSSTTFTKMPNLNSLTLETLNLKLLPNMFAPLQKLVELEIRLARHLHIVENSFDRMKNLQKLILTSSTVTLLSNIYTPGLKYLQMNWITIANISKDDFIGMPALENLTITFSNIEKIHEDAFSHLTHLKYLDLGSNNIASFTENHLRNNFQLEVLLMSYNINLKRLPVFKLNSTDNRNYSIKLFVCHNCGLESMADGTFNAMPALTQLYLNSNRLKSLPRGLFKSLSSLESLDLSDNLISNIPDDMFEGAIKLTNLVLSKNPLTTFQMTPFLHTPALSKLDLSMSQIKVWSEQNLPLNSIRVLLLEDNKLDRITVGQLKTVPNLLRFEVLLNPIKCDRVFNHTIGWLQSNRVTTTFDVSPYDTHCDGRNDDIFCWYLVQKYICHADYNNELNYRKLDQNGYQSVNDISEPKLIELHKDTKHYRYGTITSSIILLILVFITTLVTITIIKCRPHAHISHKPNMDSPDENSVYKSFENGVAFSEIPKPDNLYRNSICNSFYIVKNLPKKYFIYFKNKIQNRI